MRDQLIRGLDQINEVLEDVKQGIINSSSTQSNEEVSMTQSNMKEGLSLDPNVERVYIIYNKLNEINDNEKNQDLIDNYKSLVRKARNNVRTSTRLGIFLKYTLSVVHARVLELDTLSTREINELDMDIIELMNAVDELDDIGEINKEVNMMNPIDNETVSAAKQPVYDESVDTEPITEENNTEENEDFLGELISVFSEEIDRNENLKKIFSILEDEQDIKFKYMEPIEFIERLPSMDESIPATVKFKEFIDRNKEKENSFHTEDLDLIVLIGNYIIDLLEFKTGDRERNILIAEDLMDTGLVILSDVYRIFR